MIIQIDTREKARAISKIIKKFDEQNIKHISSKLVVGDYMNIQNPMVVIDRKQNLSELSSNLGSDKSRFYREIKLAKELGYKMIILCEHGGSVCTISDVANWNNPILKKYPNAITGRDLMERIYRVHIAYGVDFFFTDKRNTGSKIIELLRPNNDDN